MFACARSQGILWSFACQYEERLTIRSTACVLPNQGNALWTRQVELAAAREREAKGHREGNGQCFGDCIGLDWDGWERHDCTAASGPALCVLAPVSASTGETVVELGVS